MTREENARLRLKNEKLREENREMGLMQRRKVCGICILKAENARLKAEVCKSILGVLYQSRFSLACFVSCICI
jgi:hypothetical protein